jgi:hypothetical protein
MGFAPDQPADVIRVADAVEQGACVGIHQAAAEDRKFRLRNGCIHQGFEPVRFRKRIRIQQSDPFAVGRCQFDGEIISRRKPEIAARMYHFDLWKRLFDCMTGAVAAGIVHHDDFMRLITLRAQIGDAALQQVAAIPVDDDDADFGECGE